MKLLGYLRQSAIFVGVTSSEVTDGSNSGEGVVGGTYVLEYVKNISFNLRFSAEYFRRSPRLLEEQEDSNFSNKIARHSA